jgi:hypothetical protein
MLLLVVPLLVLGLGLGSAGTTFKLSRQPISSGSVSGQTSEVIAHCSPLFQSSDIVVLRLGQTCSFFTTYTPQTRLYSCCLLSRYNEDAVRLPPSLEVNSICVRNEHCASIPPSKYQSSTMGQLGDLSPEAGIAVSLRSCFADFKLIEIV